MALDNTVEQLKEKALLMGRCYYKGFGNTLSGISATACNLAVLPNWDTEGKAVEKARTLLGKIEGFYSNIPFEELHGKEEFYPLFVIQRLLPTYHQSFEQTVKTRGKYELRRLKSCSVAVVEVGELYSESFSQVLKRIRAVPGQESFCVEVPDQVKEYTWHF